MKCFKFWIFAVGLMELMFFFSSCSNFMSGSALQSHIEKESKLSQIKCSVNLAIPPEMTNYFEYGYNSNGTSYASFNENPYYVFYDWEIRLFIDKNHEKKFREIEEFKNFPEPLVTEIYFDEKKNQYVLNYDYNYGCKLIKYQYNFCLVPVCLKRPQIQSYSPVFPDCSIKEAQDIKIVFDAGEDFLSEKNFIFDEEDETFNQCEKLLNGENKITALKNGEEIFFKNIKIVCRDDDNGNSQEVSLEKYFNPPEYEYLTSGTDSSAKKTTALIIKQKTGDDKLVIPKGTLKTITVIVSRLITNFNDEVNRSYNNSETQRLEDFEWSYVIGAY